MTARRTTTWSGHDAAKDHLRATIWANLTAHGVAGGDQIGHIPRFVGAEHAAARLATLLVWQQAQVIKCNPDQAQAPVRRRACRQVKCCIWQCRV